jgi:SagB-type dehydrogenase family enzyme
MVTAIPSQSLSASTEVNRWSEMMPSAAQPHVILELLLRDIRDAGAPVAGIEPRYPSRRMRRAPQRVALPQPPTVGIDLATVLRSRTSVRNYSDETVPLEAVAAILMAAARVDSRNWHAQQTEGIRLSLLLVAWRLDGLAAGTYIYADDSHELLLVGPALPQSEAQELVLQQEFARAAALLIILGDMAEAIEREGSHGYRQLLLRAGAAAHSADLAAMSVGLAGCFTAGLLVRAVEALAGIDGCHQSTLFALAVGRQKL